MIVKGLFALQQRRFLNDTTYAFSEDPSVPFAGAVKTFGELDQPAPSHPALHLKKLLVPIDFSESSQKALIYAVRLAQRNNSSLLLLHVFEPPQFVRQLPPDYSFEAYEEMRKLCNTSSRQSEESLVRLSRDVQKGNLVIETLHRIGTPYEEIVTVAKKMEVDLIVIATHGHTGLRHFLLGSTTERVANLAPCPVLIVRQKERDFIS